MNIVITGAAGFIGSKLAEYLLLRKDAHVIGIDSFVGPTPKEMKSHNLQHLLKHPRFTLVEKNLVTINWQPILKNVDYLFHLAGMPGVRSSWGEDFREYVAFNIIGTQRLLEAVKTVPLKQFVYASTSSVYGEKSGKVVETELPEPLSPYGMTKLSGEHLCHVYRKSFGVPTVVLRFFTVYGPRQRPDMAFHRFIASILSDSAISVYGDGHQTRDFTYIDDCVKAIASVIGAPNLTGETINIGGRERASVTEVIALLEKLLQRKARIHFKPKADGEPLHTHADIAKARRLLQYEPQTSLLSGLQQEIDYIRDWNKIQ